MLFDMKKILIPRLQNRFFELVDIYLQKNDINQKQLAEMVGIKQSHLSALKPNAKKKSKRILSMNYIFKFILKGVFRMEDIYDGKAKSEREKEAWELCELCENIPFLKKINKASKLGCDIEGYVNGFLQGVEASKEP